MDIKIKYQDFVRQVLSSVERRTPSEQFRKERQGVKDSERHRLKGHRAKRNHHQPKTIKNITDNVLTY